MAPQPASRVVLVTGCSSGIGRALAVEWARRGHRVFATARSRERMPPFDAPGVEVLPLDVTNRASIEAAVAEAVRRAGRIDVLVNNAGYGLMGPVMDAPPDELRRQFATNVFGAMDVARAVVPHLLGQGHGMVVNVGSVSGLLATPFAGAYCASKAALHSLTDAMRLELEPLGVTVVSLQPGAVASRFGETSSSGVRMLDLDASPHARIRSFIEARANTSQQDAMPAEAFARRVVDALSRPNPPRILRVGTRCVQMPLLRWLLPRAVTDAMLRRRFGLDRLRK